MVSCGQRPSLARRGVRVGVRPGVAIADRCFWRSASSAAAFLVVFALLRSLLGGHLAGHCLLRRASPSCAGPASTRRGAPAVWKRAAPRQLTMMPHASCRIARHSAHCATGETYKLAVRFRRKTSLHLIESEQLLDVLQPLCLGCLTNRRSSVARLLKTNAC